MFASAIVILLVQDYLLSLLISLSIRYLCCRISVLYQRSGFCDGPAKG